MAKPSCILLFGVSVLLLALCAGCAVTEPTDQDTARVRSAINEDPATPIGVLSRQLGVADAAVLQALPDAMRRPIEPEHWRDLFAQMPDWGKVQFQLRDGEHRVTYEAENFGLLMPSPETLSVGGEGFSFDLHLAGIDSVWLVNKPMRGGPERGLIVCDADGRARYRFMVLIEPSPAFDRAWTEAE